MEEQALKTVSDLLGAKAVVDHLTGLKISEQVRVACVLAVNGGGQLSTYDITTILSLNKTPDELPA